MTLAKYSPKAKAFIKKRPIDQAAITVLNGSVRSGKTWAMIPKVLQLCKYDVPGLKVITGVSKNTIYNNILTDLFDFVGTNNYTYNVTTGVVTLYGVKWNIIGAKDEGSEKFIRGSTIGVDYSDEGTLLPESFFKMLRTRMSPENARMYMTTNPDSPFHYLKADWLDNEKMVKSGFIESLHFNMDDNLSLSEAKKEEFRASFSGVFKKRYIDGLWVIAEGAIYKDCWTEDLLYNDETRPVSLLNTGGHSEMFVPVDYGTGNPTVFLHIIDDGETYWVDREYYYDSREIEIQKTDKQYREDLEKFLADYAPGAQVIVDPSAASFKAELVQSGIWHCDAENEVLEGIRTVSSLLAQKKIRVHERCVRGRAEMEAYSWDEKAQKVGEDKPIKKRDHWPDALRYFAETKVPKYRVSM